MCATILHVDINNFYAGVEIRDCPSLAGLPLVVGGDIEARHGIVLAKNNIAKSFGIQTAETIVSAVRKCPNLSIVPAHFEKYEQAMRQSREILMRFSDKIEPFGMDEAWLDVTAYAPTVEDGREIADRIRKCYHRELGLTASVGVSFCKVFAKLGSDMKKPDATTVITKNGFKEKIFALPVESLLFVGKETMHRLNLRGVFTIGDLARTDPALLCAWLGSSGAELYRYANGLDESPVQNYGIETALKSISNSSTPPHDICCAGDALRMLQSLGENVAARLRKHKLKAGVVVLHVRDSTLSTFERQVRLPRPSCLSIELRDAAFNLLCENYDWKRPIRSHSAYVHAVLYPQMSRFSSVCLTITNKPTGSLKLKKLPTSYAKNTAAAVLFSARQYQHGKLLSCRKENSIRFAELSKLQAIKKKR